MIIKRLAETSISKLLKQFPAVGIVGPRQCGKTTLALIVKSSMKNTALYFDLESPADARKFSDPELFLLQHQDDSLIIDEVQRLPELTSILRSVIDKKRKAGRFMLLGSASPDLIKGSSESLAGRIMYIEVHPFNLLEVSEKPNTLTKHWFRGGFPDAWNAKNESEWFTWQMSFVRTFLERDLNTLFGTTFSPQLMNKLWRMIAFYHSNLWNAQSFAKGLDISPTTVNRYIEYLEGAFMIRRLMPYDSKINKRLVKAPKVYIRDSGLLHYLLDIQNSKSLIYNVAIGASWEGYVIEQIIQLVPPHIHPYFYRTHDNSEMDLILVKGLTVIACIEIKYSTSPSVTRGTYECIKDLGCKNNYIIIPNNDEAYPINKTLKIVGLKPFLNNVLPKIIK